MITNMNVDIYSNLLFHNVFMTFCWTADAEQYDIILSFNS